MLAYRGRTHFRSDFDTGTYRRIVAIIAAICALLLYAVLGGCAQERVDESPNDLNAEIATSTDVADVDSASDASETGSDSGEGAVEDATAADDSRNYNSFGTEVIGEASGAEVSIMIRNGSAVDGAGAAAAESLRSEDYIVDIAAKQFAGVSSGKTQIIYQNKEGIEAIAAEIQATLGTGELLQLDRDFYADYLKEDITIIINLVWVNANMLAEGQDPYLYTPGQL